MQRVTCRHVTIVNMHLKMNTAAMRNGYILNHIPASITKSSKDHPARHSVFRVALQILPEGESWLAWPSKVSHNLVYHFIRARATRYARAQLFV